jgi:hypothetical protein
MNNTRYYSKFINSNTNTKKSITTFTNHFYFSFITGMLRGQRLPLSIFSQPVGVVSSIGQSELGKPMSSVKELFSSIVNFQIGLSAFSNLSMVLLAIQIRGVQLKCLSISKMNIVDNQTRTRMII